jgi:hypothetical protein
MICQLCNKKMEDLTHGKGDIRNYICGGCGSHFFKGFFYTKSQWNYWIEINS